MKTATVVAVLALAGVALAMHPAETLQRKVARESQGLSTRQVDVEDYLSEGQASFGVEYSVTLDGPSAKYRAVVAQADTSITATIDNSNFLVDVYFVLSSDLDDLDDDEFDFTTYSTVPSCFLEANQQYYIVVNGELLDVSESHTVTYTLTAVQEACVLSPVVADGAVSVPSGSWSFYVLEDTFSSGKVLYVEGTSGAHEAVFSVGPFGNFYTMSEEYLHTPRGANRFQVGVYGRSAFEGVLKVVDASCVSYDSEVCPAIDQPILNNEEAGVSSLANLELSAEFAVGFGGAFLSCNDEDYVRALFCPLTFPTCDSDGFATLPCISHCVRVYGNGFDAGCFGFGGGLVSDDDVEELCEDAEDDGTFSSDSNCYNYDWDGKISGSDDDDSVDSASAFAPAPLVVLLAALLAVFA